MLTITSKEFNKIYKDTSVAFREVTYSLCRKNTYGMELSDEFQRAKELFLYMMAISTWKQGEFDDFYHYNCLDKEDIYKIYSKVKKLR